MDGSLNPGEVVWAPDPYNSGSDPRPYLVLSNDLPYGDQESICAGITHSDLPDNHAIGDSWVTGEPPTDRTSYCSPWVIATVKHDQAKLQGLLESGFTTRMVEAARDYLTAELPL